MTHGYLTAIAAGAWFAVILAGSPAEASPWPWCADYTGRNGGGGTNCGFASWVQCQAAISGVGGWCYPNPHYRGEAPPRRRQRLRP
jgi:hypothetical protein